jgi:hypothetical protein
MVLFRVDLATLERPVLLKRAAGVATYGAGGTRFGDTDTDTAIH